MPSCVTHIEDMETGDMMMAQKADTVIETTRGPVTVAKDAYKDGWRLYISQHMRFSDERFGTKKEAVAFLDRFLPE